MKDFLQHIALFIVLALATVFFPSCKEKDPEPAVVRCQLTVIVTDESARPVQNALVQAGIIQKTTDAEGKCTFSDLKIETIILKVSAEDYLPVSHPVSLTQASQTEKVALTKEPPYLSVEVGEIDTKEMKSKGTVQIRSNLAWRIESSSDALSFSPREGIRSGTVEVSWDFPEEQEDEDLALAEFTIVSLMDPVTIPVRYHLPIRITKKEGFIFNQAGVESVPSIARLTFSRKVVPLEAWAPGYTELGIQAVDDHTVDVVMPANFVDLGEDYGIDRLKVESANDDGVVFDGKVVVPFHDGKVAIEGVYESWYLTPDESRLWVSTEFPCRIYELDARSFSVLKSFDLDWEPGKLQLNPYNNRLYVVDDSHGVLKALDPASGATLKTITVERDELDHPDTPVTVAHNILFADNGLGVLVTTSADGVYRWFFVDSRRDDVVEHYTPFEEEFGSSFYDYCFSDMYLDHSGTKIVSQPWMHVDQRVFIIDCLDKSVTWFDVDKDLGSPGVQDAGGLILRQRMHKGKDLAILCAPYSMTVYDYVHPAYTPAFTNGLDFRFSFADFCYGESFGDDVCTYVFSGIALSNGIRWTLFILNHTTHTVQFAAPMRFEDAHAFGDAIPFLEGDRLVLLCTDGNGKTYFVTINTSRLRP
jgi:hypothetical protein